MVRRIAVIIIIAFAVLGILAVTHRSARAALDTGVQAPLFTAQATLGSNPFTFNLADALKKGPVVLYFYPKAFTKGCTKEAHDFAEATDKYKALNATVIGVSKDDIATLKDFGTTECGSKFAVASDTDLAIAKSYDATVTLKGDLYANRISYVIAPNGKIVYQYTSLDPDQHVANTLAALQKLENK
jgi:thioredoxin-dependent peroxiredoxin